MIIPISGVIPKINIESFIAENASVVGDVEVHKDASIWFGAVIRGDVNKIIIGEGSNIQDNCTIHVNEGSFNVEIGEMVAVGHNAILHGCKIGNEVLVGMGSIILDGAEIGDKTIIGAGSIVTSGKKIPSGVLCMGSPAKIIRELTAEEKQSIRESAEHYLKISGLYKK